MARIRSVKPEICESETMARLTAEVERTFVRLWTHLDDHGRAKDHAGLIKAALFPLHDDVTAQVVDTHLEALAAEGLIVRYQVDGRRFLACPSWSEHQHPQKPRPSKCPDPSDGVPVPVRDVSRTPTGTVPDESGPVVVVGVVEVGVAVEVEGDAHPADPGTSLALVADPSPATPTAAAYPLDFDAWWELYPRKVGKQAGLASWHKARRKVGTDRLYEALSAHVTAWRASGQDVQFIPHPATWLNEGRYDDPPPAAHAAARPGRVSTNQQRIAASLARAEGRQA